MKQHMSSRVEATSAEPAAVTSTVTEDSAFASIAASLAEIRKLEGVKGYILRSNESAIIDLPEPTKIAQYATVSYQIYESSAEIAKQSSIAGLESVLVEGGRLNLLCVFFGENKACVLMDKGVDHSLLIKRILI